MGASLSRAVEGSVLCEAAANNEAGVVAQVSRAPASGFWAPGFRLFAWALRPGVMVSWLAYGSRSGAVRHLERLRGLRPGHNRRLCTTLHTCT